jgi:nucleotide-binding universal stress UspA family protein
MKTILAAIDNSPAARPVLDTAIRFASLLDASVTALTVAEDGNTTAQEAADAVGLTLETAHGSPVDVIAERLASPDVVLGVIGARGSATGPRPTGSTAVEIFRRTPRPLAVVSPECIVQGPNPGDRVLVPLNGTRWSAEVARQASSLLDEAGLHVLALHVFDTEHMPKFWDQPQHAGTAWSTEFAERNLAEIDGRVELRTGLPAAQVLQVATEHGVDLIVLGLSEELPEGGSTTVRSVLSETCVPVLLIPVPAQHE